MDKERLKYKITAINKLLSDKLPKFSEFGSLCEAMDYSVLNGGKRLRAIMLLEAFYMFSNDEKAYHFLAEPFAAAIEFIHAYSLVHDDLPAMDNDVLRRGKPTTHIAFGHAMGVLTGDALLNYAYELISDIMNNPELASDSEIAAEYSRRVLKAFNVLAVKPGFSGMIGGQVLDTCFEYSKEADFSNFFPEAEQFADAASADLNKVRFYLRIYELKTSQLFETALMCGGLLGGADKHDAELLEKAGRALGLAFQIEDDILDIISTSDTLGKSVNIDEKNNKATIARQLGIKNARKMVDFYTVEAVEALTKTGKECSFLIELFKSLVYREL